MYNEKRFDRNGFYFGQKRFYGRTGRRYDRGYNSMLKKQQEQGGEALVSTVLFDDRQEVLHDRKPLDKVQPITEKEYYVRGCTALLDAIGGAIHHIGNVHKYAREEDRPENTIFIITTDGMENSSRKYNYKMVKELVERQKIKYGWEFLFLGANMDAIEVAGRFGISAERAVTYQCDSQGTQLNYEILGRTLSTYRRTCAVQEDWKEEIQADFERRGK